MIIRIFLLTAFVSLGFLFLRWRGLRSRAWSLIVLVILGLGVVVAVLFPEVTTTVANAIGVGRGADLLTYLLIVIVGFLTLALHRRIQVLQRQLTELARDIALYRSAAPDPSGTADERPD